MFLHTCCRSCCDHAIFIGKTSRTGTCILCIACSGSPGSFQSMSDILGTILYLLLSRSGNLLHHFLLLPNLRLLSRWLANGVRCCTWSRILCHTNIWLHSWSHSQTYKLHFHNLILDTILCFYWILWIACSAILSIFDNNWYHLPQLHLWDIPRIWSEGRPHCTSIVGISQTYISHLGF